MKKWVIDKAHSFIGFKVKHLMISTVRGEFTDFEGEIGSKDDSFQGAKANFLAQSRSINTHNETREGHLKSADFFDVESYPTITFESKSFEKVGNNFQMVGDLTIKGVTKSVNLDVLFNGITTDMDGIRVAGFNITGTINRQDFGVSWNKILDTGSILVGDEVLLELHVETKEE